MWTKLTASSALLFFRSSTEILVLFRRRGDAEHTPLILDSCRSMKVQIKRRHIFISIIVKFV
eukprot:COSAG02_NODE_349_length_24073_cov_102.816092_19_plen_62_part_00